MTQGDGSKYKRQNENKREVRATLYRCFTVNE